MRKRPDACWADEWSIEAATFKDFLTKVYIVLISFPLLPEMERKTFHFLGTSVDVPLNIYFKLCVLLARELSNADDKTYYYSKAKTVYEKKNFTIFRDELRSWYEEALPFYKKGCRPRYETIYGKDLAYLMHLNLSGKMSSLGRETIDKRNKAISDGMKKFHSKRRKNEQ